MKVLAAIICAAAVSALPAQTAPAFDVASIHASGADQRGAQLRFSAGRFSVENCTLNYIIQRAYDLRDFQVTGGPGWVDDGNGARFDIQAKAAASTTDKELKLMAQTLLADRFHLKTHRETKLLPVYALVIAKTGSKLHPSKPGEHFSIGSYPGNIEATNAPMSAFIDENSGKVDRPIVDRTGLTGGFDFNLRWSPDPNSGDIFTAIQDQLGLRLEPQKAPFEILVIDSIERPSAN